MPDQASLIAIAIVLAIGIPVFLLVSAVLLRAGVSLYNRFVGGPTSPKAVPEPSFNKAIGIVFIVGLVNALIGAASGMNQGLMANANELKITATEGAMMGGSFLLGILVMSAALTILLPTRFGRAIGVSLCHMLVCIAVGAVVAGLGVSLGLAMTAMM